MIFYHRRLRIPLAAARQSSQLFAHEPEPARVCMTVRLQGAWPRAIESVALLLGNRQRRTIGLALLALGASIFGPMPGLAETVDVPGKYAVLGVGSVPCWNVVQALNRTAQFTEADRRAMLSWAEGYLSQYNVAEEGVYDITRGANADTLQNWFVGYCQKNPSSKFIDAVDQFILETIPHYAALPSMD